jgi:hypothetical protein
VKTIFSLTFFTLFVFALVVWPQQAMAADKECQSLMKKIDDLVDHVEKLSAANQDLIDKNEHAASEDVKKHGAQTLEHSKSTLRATKVKIDNLLDELCACCGGKPGNTAKPTPGQATSDTLKKVFDSVHIGIGIGGGGYSSGHDERHHGEDRHRTADKVPTSKKTTTGTSHKTVTAGCKCHPCTCSPCTCH